MVAKQVKSRQRVADHGEVFTAEREVKAMCDLVKQETERIDSRFLEPACGDGNFLAEILTRKLAIVKKKYKRSAYDWERNSLLALGSMYGVDILLDNIEPYARRNATTIPELPPGLFLNETLFVEMPLHCSALMKTNRIPQSRLCFPNGHSLSTMPGSSVKTTRLQSW